jgi:hypothetical protein
MPNETMITIVSGLPRSGTSLMMQMLVAGGMTPLADGERAADADNPRGYLEWERIKTLPQDPACIGEAEGKVVKVISKLLLALPAGRDYRIVFMERPMQEVLASQAKMLERRGVPKSASADRAMASAFERHLQEVFTWMEKTPGVKSLRLAYHAVLSEPAAIADRLRNFLDTKLDAAAMIRAVDATLYRNRGA